MEHWRLGNQLFWSELFWAVVFPALVIGGICAIPCYFFLKSQERKRKER
jgi:hypothetical protein